MLITQFEMAYMRQLCTKQYIENTDCCDTCQYNLVCVSNMFHEFCADTGLVSVPCFWTDYDIRHTGGV